MGLFKPHGRSRRPVRADAIGRDDPQPPRADDVPAALTVVVHTLAHAVGALRAAARAGGPVMLLSAPDAGIYAGPGWFGALVEAAREAVPDARLQALLDCGDRPGAALAAIRAQMEAVIFIGRADVARRLTDIAAQQGTRLLTARPAATLDLGDDHFASEAESEKLCTQFFARIDLSGGRPPNP